MICKGRLRIGKMEEGIDKALFVEDLVDDLGQTKLIKLQISVRCPRLGSPLRWSRKYHPLSWSASPVRTNQVRLQLETWPELPTWARTTWRLKILLSVSYVEVDLHASLGSLL